jgi:hypothetical protein
VLLLRGNDDGDNGSGVEGVFEWAMNVFMHIAKGAWTLDTAKAIILGHPWTHTFRLGGTPIICARPGIWRSMGVHIAVRPVQ